MAPSLTALVADDHPKMGEITSTILRAAGFQVRIARSAEAALSIVRGAPIDLAVIEFRLFPLDGLEWTRKIRRESANRFMPIIMLTSYAQQRVVEGARDSGVNAFLAKPYTAKALLGRVRELVEIDRPFASSPTYFGPDRRRRPVRGFPGPWRRQCDTAIEPRPAEREPA